MLWLLVGVMCFCAAKSLAGDVTGTRRPGTVDGDSVAAVAVGVVILVLLWGTS